MKHSPKLGTERPWSVTYIVLNGPSYPRNRRIRRYLEDVGCLVTTVCLDPNGSYPTRCLRLLKQVLKSSSRCDAVVLGELGLQYFWMAWVVARIRKAILVIDWFVGLYETNVEDWHRFPGRSLRARMHFMVDRFAARAADLLITDTDARASMIRELAHLREMPSTLPVGAPDWAQPQPLPKDAHSMSVLYYGNYLPLHGLDYVIEALEQVSVENRVVLTLLGDGELRSAVMEEVANRSLQDWCKFRDPVQESELPDIIRAHDAVLGVFGQSSKAESVIANKVWQGLACGRVVITRKSRALEEINEIVGRQLRQVDPDCPQSLAAALSSLAARDVTAPSEDVAVRLEQYVSTRYSAFGDRLFDKLRGRVRG